MLGLQTLVDLIIVIVVTSAQQSTLSAPHSAVEPTVHSPPPPVQAYLLSFLGTQLHYLPQLPSPWDAVGLCSLECRWRYRPLPRGQWRSPACSSSSPFSRDQLETTAEGSEPSGLTNPNSTITTLKLPSKQALFDGVITLSWLIQPVNEMTQPLPRRLLSLWRTRKENPESKESRFGTHFSTWTG